MSDSNHKRYLNLVKDVKELYANSVNGTNPISPEDWLKHFAKLLFDDKQNRSSLLEERINEMLSCNSFSDLDFRITKDDIKKAISSLKSGKVTGLDKISSEMIKKIINVLLSVYEKLFNAILRRGIYPTSWHDIYICQIYKSGSRSDPSNYRGIAITNILCKVFSIILNNRLEKFITSNNLIDDSQIGFKKNCRTSHHMLNYRYL